jgi:uncharacterized protein YeaO (DUF488 family)
VLDAWPAGEWVSTMGWRLASLGPRQLRPGRRCRAARQPPADRGGHMTSRLDVRMRRVYDDPSPADGARVLVDRVWPRGLAKATARIDEWAKVVAPSTELRRWYGHDPSKFDQFRHRYEAELAEPERQAVVQQLRALARSGPLTLLTATKDIDHSQAAVLIEHLHSAR